MKLILESTEKIVDYYKKAEESQQIYRDIYIKGKGTNRKKLHHSSEEKKDNTEENK